MTNETRSARFAAAAVLAVMIAAPAPVAAATITKTVDRKFPTGQFCPLESRAAAGADLSFVAAGPRVRVTFTVDNFKGQCEDAFGSLGQPCLTGADCPPDEPCRRLCTTSLSPCTTDADCPGERCGPWNEVAFDNVTVVLKSVFDAHLLEPSPFFQDCYFATTPPGQTGPGLPFAPSYDFNASGSTEVYLELFDSPAGLSGWVGQVAFDTRSAPRVPAAVLFEDLDQSPGSLGLGRVADGAVPVSASRLFTGLTPGARYVVFGWWSIRLADRLTLTINDNPCPDGDADGFVSCSGCDPDPGQTCGDCDDARPHCATSCVDGDGDGWCTGMDCDDGTASCTSSCSDDLDLDGTADCRDGCLDFDGDGWGTPGGATNTCLGGDCEESNRLCNVDCTDLDGDAACLPGDCDDNSPSVLPGAPEINDGVDNQCAGDPGFGAVDELDPTLTSTKVPGASEICWAPQVLATAYQFVRSTTPQFPSPCVVGATTSTCFTDLEAPTPGQAFHYLVRPTAPHGGSWGNDSQGLERVNVCFNPNQDSVVLNEIDYDQPGLDTLEFVELYNRGPGAVSLGDLALVLVNGANNLEYGRVNLSGTLPPGGYALIRTAAVPALGDLNFLFAVTENALQNGAPDGIALLRVTDGALLDALSYEGLVTAAVISGQTYNLVEGTPTPLADSNVVPGSLVRLPNGTDTNNANTDWRLSATPTPGAPNVP